MSAAGLTGCSSLLYHPTDYTHVDTRTIDKPYQELFLLTEDHVRLHAWYFQAKDPKAMIVFFHGNGQNLTSHFASLYWILEHQVSFMIFDYRGYHHSEGSPDPEGTIRDGKAALLWTQAEAKKLGVPWIVFAQSLGGAIGMRSVLDNLETARPHALIIDSSFLSYESAGNSVMSSSFITWPFQWLAYLFFSDEWAPEDHIHKLPHDMPLLVMHGLKDGTIDFELGQEVFNRAPAKDKLFWSIPDGYHGDSFWRHEGRYRKKLLDWMESRNLGYSQASKASGVN